MFLSIINICAYSNLHLTDICKVEAVYIQTFANNLTLAIRNSMWQNASQVLCSKRIFFRFCSVFIVQVCRKVHLSLNLHDYLLLSHDESQGYTGFASIVPLPYFLTHVLDNSKSFHRLHSNLVHTCIWVRKGTLY